MSFQAWIEQNKSKFIGEIKYQEPLSKYSYYKIGGKADLFFLPKGLPDLYLLNEGLQKFSIPYFILGAGSNLLISDLGYRGLIIKTTDLNKNIFEDKKNSTLQLGSSVMVSSLLRMAMHKGWGGLEFLAGVPGSIGGVITMNAGTHLGETKSAVQRVSLFSLQNSSGLIERKTLESDFEYRKNLFIKSNDIIYETQWKIKFEDPKKVTEVIQATLKRRKESQPVEYPSCGSVFKNPRDTDLKSWQVIDHCGLRGFQIGQAQFSQKHSNFIINLGNAQASDVKALIDLAKKKAKDELNIHLEEEVRLLGEF